MSTLTDNIYDTLEELILEDIEYIDSAVFSESSNGVITDSMFKYIDHLLMHRRTETPDLVIYPVGSMPQLYTYSQPDTPRGAG